MAKILVGTDTSASADLAVEAAARMARDRDAELLVLQVRANGSTHDAADPKKSADPDRYLAHMPERFPQLRVRSWSEAGDPADRLVETAERERVDTIVLDKTGTVTTGKMSLVEVVPAPGVTEDDALRLVGPLEDAAEHPIGQVIAAEAKDRLGPLLVGGLAGAATGAHVDDDIATGRADQIARFRVTCWIAGDLALLVAHMEMNDRRPGRGSFNRCLGNLLFGDRQRGVLRFGRP